jgi:hypothetical protein
VNLELTIRQSFAKPRRIWGSNFAGEGKNQSVVRRGVLAHKIVAQHQDSCRAFVTTNGCFPSKATKIPSLSWRRTDRFSAQNGKVDPNPRAWQRNEKEKVDEK